MLVACFFLSLRRNSFLYTLLLLRHIPCENICTHGEVETEKKNKTLKKKQAHDVFFSILQKERNSEKKSMREENFTVQGKKATKKNKKCRVSRHRDESCKMFCLGVRRRRLLRVEH